MPDPLILRTPDGNACSFWWDTAKNEFASQSAGHPIFDKVLKMKVFKPGDRDSQPHFEIRRVFSSGAVKHCMGEMKGKDGVIHRAPWDDLLKDQIAAFESQSGDGGDLNGMPLSQWARVDIAQVATLNAVGIHTVEALAEVPDSQVRNLGHNGAVLRDQAKAYLLAAAGAAPMDKIIAESAELRAQNADLQRQITELAAKLDHPEPAKRGRPPKHAQAAE